VDGFWTLFSPATPIGGEYQLLAMAISPSTGPIILLLMTARGGHLSLISSHTAVSCASGSMAGPEYRGTLVGMLVAAGANLSPAINLPRLSLCLDIHLPGASCHYQPYQQDFFLMSDRAELCGFTSIHCPPMLAVQTAESSLPRADALFPLPYRRKQTRAGTGLRRR
jgi:hypothetical protein